MKKNWNSFRQALDRLVYDGTARTGRSSDDVANLFIEKLFQITANFDSDVTEEISIRKIKYLVHFTMAFNVSGILKHGLIPRNYLDKKPLCNIIESVFPDDNRLDKLLESNCISVSYPNYMLFYSKRTQIGKNWAVVLIDPEILSQCPCLYFEDNAASFITGNKSIEGFRKLFEDISDDDFHHSLRTALKIPEHYTTNPQAEILVNSVIPPKYIKAVCVEKWDIKRIIESRCGNNFKEKIWVTDKYFKPRHDHSYWKTKKQSKTSKFFFKTNGTAYVPEPVKKKAAQL